MEQLGLVMAGGAARGAYQAGALRYLLTELPKTLGASPWPSIVSGCSVGSLNAVPAASRDLSKVLRTSQMWSELRIEQVYRLHGNSVFGAMSRMFYPEGGASVLDATPLMKLVSRELPIRAVREAIGTGKTRALIVSATSLATGFNVLFTDSAADDLDLQAMPGTRVVRDRIRARHLLASCALPLLFPPITIDGELFVDGGLRQNTPLRPVIHAGADRILMFGVHTAKKTAEEAQANTDTAGPLAPARPQKVVPSLPYLAGATLGALLQDPIERDLHQAEKVNQIAEWGRQRYGEAFVDAMRTDLGMHPVDIHYLLPSIDLGEIAFDAWKNNPPKVPGQLGWLLSTFADRVNDAGGEADMLSYLLFDRSFTAACERIGFEDARKQEEALCRFLAPTLPEELR